MKKVISKVNSFVESLNVNNTQRGLYKESLKRITDQIDSEYNLTPKILGKILSGKDKGNLGDIINHKAIKSKIPANDVHRIKKLLERCSILESVKDKFLLVKLKEIKDILRMDNTSEKVSQEILGICSSIMKKDISLNEDNIYELFLEPLFHCYEDNEITDGLVAKITQELPLSLLPKVLAHEKVAEQEFSLITILNSMWEYLLTEENLQSLFDSLPNKSFCDIANQAEDGELEELVEKMVDANICSTEWIKENILDPVIEEEMLEDYEAFVASLSPKIAALYDIEYISDRKDSAIGSTSPDLRGKRKQVKTQEIDTSSEEGGDFNAKRSKTEEETKDDASVISVAESAIAIGANEDLFCNEELDI
ncbi:MAG: hypothetical protein RLZZ59_621 [Pseudomonadota bacterium]|jgi:hypothetical protein